MRQSLEWSAGVIKFVLKDLVVDHPYSKELIDELKVAAEVINKLDDLFKDNHDRAKINLTYKELRDYLEFTDEVSMNEVGGETFRPPERTP